MIRGSFSKCTEYFRRSTHTKAVKIGASLFVLTTGTFAPTLYASVTRTTISGYFYYVLSVNNFANFFIYIWIDGEFRSWILRKKTE